MIIFFILLIMFLSSISLIIYFNYLTNQSRQEVIKPEIKQRLIEPMQKVILHEVIEQALEEAV